MPEEADHSLRMIFIAACFLRSDDDAEALRRRIDRIIMLLFFDTETTGVVNVRIPEDHHEQPRLVQIAALLVDAEGAVAGQMAAIVRPQGFVIPPRAAGIHGITDDRAMRYGADLRSVLSMFAQLCRLATVAVAHNVNFDIAVMRAEYKRAGIKDPLVPLRRYCTMREAAGIVRARDGAGRFKFPSLAETYRHFFGCEHEGAHDAWADVLACRRCFDAITDRRRVLGVQQTTGLGGGPHRGSDPLDAILE